MEKEELVEMINSTINTNGSGAITGEALNLALQAIVETMGTGSGAEKLQGYFDDSAWQQTEEEKALNAQLYTKITTALANDQPISVLGIMKTSSAIANMASLSIMSMDGQITITFFVADGILYVIPTADGTITARIGG